MRSCLGNLLAVAGIIVAYFLYGFTLGSHDFYSSPKTLRVNKNCEEVTCSMARLTPDGLPKDRKKSLPGTESFQFLRCAPFLFVYSDSTRTYNLAWLIDCATDARYYRGGENRVIDHCPQKVHLPAGSRVGVVMKDGTEITATLEDSAVYKGTVRPGRGSGTYVQRLLCQTEYQEADYLKLKDCRVVSVWFETAEGRLNCKVGRMGQLELRHKVRQLTGEHPGKKLRSLLEPQGLMPENIL